MTTGGLSYTDVGNQAIVGGLAREFYERVASWYRSEYEQYDAPITFVFEPHVAAGVLRQMLLQRGVTVELGCYLDRAATCSSHGGWAIRSLRCIGGLTVRAEQFVDTSYEGDLMAASGVTFTVGRESAARYQESLNGMQVLGNHQFSTAIDPFVEKGNGASGLLPGLESAERYSSGTLETMRGTGDSLIQAYNFRVCMELRPDNQVPFPRPDGYDRDEYALCSRWLSSVAPDALVTRNNQTVLRKFDFITTTKTDTNNWGAFSTDLVGGSNEWPTASYADREAIFQRHLRYQQGYHYFMANDSSVPDRIRAAYARWGLAKDEFGSTGHWPHQLYVREGRRMVGAYVITEADCRGETVAADPIGLAAYTMDSHNTQRIIVDGAVKNEGNVEERVAKPYGVSFRAIVPMPGECVNLTVPVTLSASHIAFGSVRMEPVFMMLAESATLAAAIAVDQSSSVQEVPYPTLQSALRNRGLVLSTDTVNEAVGNPSRAVLPGPVLTDDLSNGT